MLPSLDGGENSVWIGGPDEGFGVGIGFLDEAVDGCLKVDNRPEDAALEAASGEFGEEALDREPGRGGTGKVEGEARVSGQPGADLGVLVCSVVVENDVDE